MTDYKIPTWVKVLVVLLMLAVTLDECGDVHAQSFTHYDDLAFQLEGLGYLEIGLPITESYLPEIGTYTDSMFYFVFVDSLQAADTVMSGWNFFQITKNAWLAGVTTVDTTRITILYHTREYTMYDSTWDGTNWILTSYLVNDTIHDTLVGGHSRKNVGLLYIVPESNPAWIENLLVKP